MHEREGWRGWGCEGDGDGDGDVNEWGMRRCSRTAGYKGGTMMTMMMYVRRLLQRRCIHVCERDNAVFRGGMVGCLAVATDRWV